MKPMNKKLISKRVTNKRDNKDTAAKASKVAFGPYSHNKGVKQRPAMTGPEKVEMGMKAGKSKKKNESAQKIPHKAMRLAGFSLCFCCLGKVNTRVPCHSKHRCST